MVYQFSLLDDLSIKEKTTYNFITIRRFATSTRQISNFLNRDAILIIDTQLPSQ